jgi:hypothetical protein
MLDQRRRTRHDEQEQRPEHRPPGPKDEPPPQDRDQLPLF